MMLSTGCVAGNETATRLGTIEKNNVTISGQVEDLNLKTNNIEQQGIFAIGGGGAIWILGAFIAMLGFFSYMIRLLLHRRNLNKMLGDLTDCVYRSPNYIRKRIRQEMKEMKTKNQMKQFVETRKNHARKGFFENIEKDNNANISV